jgi:hypothetical protein
MNQGSAVVGVVVVVLVSACSDTKPPADDGEPPSPVPNVARGSTPPRPAVAANPDGGDASPGCVSDLQSDPANCGACGTACGALQQCQNGVCALPCAPGTVLCDGACIEPEHHPRYCGATGGCGKGSGSRGVTCAVNEVCVNGVCEADCAGGLVACATASGEVCVDVRTSAADCGTCGNVCPAGTTCLDGGCCAIGWTSCFGECRDTSTDPTACGGCGIRCEDGERCLKGKCVGGGSR